MHWKLTEQRLDEMPEGMAFDGRYVVHRHHDGQGAHIDLRLEAGGVLMGWRVAGMALDGAYATEKAPHPLSWLDQDGDAVREDGGRYAWRTREAERRELLLASDNGVRVITAEAKPGLPPPTQERIIAALIDTGHADGDPAVLVRDGITARHRAIERLCGLGRELDGEAFDEVVWRDALRSLDLDGIHRHLRAFEVRFDRKYPPEPVSQPEPLPVIQGDDRFAAAMTIVRDN